jgi:hypothetical protein
MKGPLCNHQGQEKSVNHCSVSSPPKLWMNVIVSLQGIFHIGIKGAGKWQDSVEIINEALFST